jgi:hypothetical protein
MSRSPRARRALDPIRVDQPEPGLWKLRLHSGCWPYVPARIIFEAGLWSAEIDGKSAGLPNSDPTMADGVMDIWLTDKDPISAAEYNFRTSEDPDLRPIPLKAWARSSYPDHPCLDPRKRVDPATLRLTPEFGNPTPPAPLVEEPLNRPPPPAPLDPKAILEWLAYEEEALADSIAADVAQLAEDAQTKEITTAQRLGEIGGNMDTAKAHLRLADKHRETAKRPFLLGGRAVDDWFKRLTTRLDAAMAPVQRLMNDYAAKEDARRRAEEAARAAAAKAEAERLAKAAREALQRQYDLDAPQLLDDARNAALDAQEAAELASGRSADLTRAETAYGRTMSGQETWDFQIEDVSKVPLKYLQVNEVLVRQTLKAYASDDAVAAREDAKHGRSPIPGIKLLRSIVMRNR